MATVSADVEGPSDAELINAVRKGTVSAYGSLYERHVAAAYNLARQLSRSAAEADDLVSEAFAKVLDTLRAGRGPDSAFRAYLLTTLRHTAYDRTRRDRRLELSDDVETVGGAAVAQPFADPAVQGLERSLAAQAFARLPERWQAVLWHTEIEGQSPTEIAPILGLTPNGVSALAYRAREGLRQAYLQVHLAETTESRCRATAERLGAWTRAGLAKREKAQVEAHLDECARCRSLAAELADVNGALRGFVAPIVLGVGTVGYLAAAGATQGGTLAAAGAAGAATSGATRAITSAPRQFVGVAASTVALAAAIAVGLTSGGTPPPIPAAVPITQQPTPAPPAQAPPATQQPPQQVPPPEPADEPPAPVEPPEQTTPPQTPPTQDPPAQETPTQEPPTQTPPTEEPPTEEPPTPEPTEPPTTENPPAPLPPQLSAATPATPVGLVAGGDGADLPITVTNTGGTLSDPVSATLTLPSGVRAVSAGPNRLGGQPLLRLGAQPTGAVDCPGSVDGVVTCASRYGLRPGESVTLRFRLLATEGQGGEITGVVNAGSTATTVVQVRVAVSPPPVVDGVALSVDVWWDGLFPAYWHRPLLVATVRNTGTSSRPVTVTVDRRAELLSAGQEVTCAPEEPAAENHRATTVCRTRAELAPGERMPLYLLLSRAHPEPVRDDDQDRERVEVTATLGSASVTEVEWFGDWEWPWPPTASTPPPADPADPPAPPATDDPPATDPPTTDPPTSENPPTTSPPPATTTPPATPDPATPPPSPPATPPNDGADNDNSNDNGNGNGNGDQGNGDGPGHGDGDGRGEDHGDGRGGGLGDLLDWLLGRG